MRVCTLLTSVAFALSLGLILTVGSPYFPHKIPKSQEADYARLEYCLETIDQIYGRLSRPRFGRSIAVSKHRDIIEK
ncbi:hypothetical protein CEXT_344931 [Caerostris extrusa]|uniref:Neuropeptide Y n=1 Tax=Caerostris extrusa TaxID=172846 RepID=A0AAV4UEQ7_CAEEX|nr:hypothetical protein CEXT_344931 [Caerostris extrusa]